MESGGLLDVLAHPNPRRYPNQKVFVVAVIEYVDLVPQIEAFRTRPSWQVCCINLRPADSLSKSRI